ncbi:LOW QUALITY PROTEIN: hypothetical protein Cgig2_003195 [Carnegiea gigantea]|uniref:Uncharacterized protein n=1 Tax=Carnegiea gigantea TaxID=171969 RepID=A0A9Q1JIV1_9CARY|nr:LOW QUALITY PROTEIN: hypothetical protein Cgig2_003195 [Carnegiea gigantea]
MDPTSTSAASSSSADLVSIGLGLFRTSAPSLLWLTYPFKSQRIRLKGARISNTNTPGFTIRKRTVLSNKIGEGECKALLCIIQKLKKTKLDLKSCSKRTFGNFKHKLERNTEQLLHVEAKLVHEPNSVRFNNWHYKLGRFTRKDWLVNGDRNSRYFYQSMKARKTRSKITKVKDNLGVWVNESAQAEKMFTTNFTARFKSVQAGTSNIDMEMLNLKSLQKIIKVYYSPFKKQK